MASGDQTVTAQAEPWSQAQPYIKQGFSEASNIYNDFTPEFYQGQSQADFSTDQEAAQQGIRQFATQDAPNIMNSAIGAYKYGTGENVLDVANNPYVTGMAQAAANRAYSGLAPQLAGIRGGAIQSGGYGGSRQGIAEGQALGGAADAATQAAAGIYGNAYGQGLGHQAQTMGMTGGLMNTGFQPYQQLGASGGQQQSREQNIINDAQRRHQFEQNIPYQKLQNYMSGITGFGGTAAGAGSQSTTQPGASALSNLGGLASLFGML
jgi:hypothetical protein